MTRRAAESGFTLIEILVASMLMAMLITILTMVFNSSSIAWSTGKASVSEMDHVRRRMSAASLIADGAVPRVDAGDSKQWGCLVGPWRPDGALRHRALVGVTGGASGSDPDQSLYKKAWDDLMLGSEVRQGASSGNQQLWATLSSLDVQTSGNAKDYVVGVWSLGPDGNPNSGDDISTWPDLE